MAAGSGGRKIFLSLFFMILGGLFGAGLATLYAPSSGERTRHNLRMKKEWARRRAGYVTASIRETMDRLIADMRDITARLRETGVTRACDTGDERPKAGEAGKTSMNGEHTSFGRSQRS
jgi:hypothetical protein